MRSPLPPIHFPPLALKRLQKRPDLSPDIPGLLKRKDRAKADLSSCPF